MSAWLRQHRQAFGSALRRLGLLNAVVIGVAPRWLLDTIQAGSGLLLGS